MLTANEHQDIARSSYADMLNDDERNRAFYHAIQASVSSLVTSKEHNPSGDRFFHCCDIGTGSGLLSMMIVASFHELRYDKFHVTAFEAFRPMAACAAKVVESNDMTDFITVIPGRSDSIQQASYDLLVAELLDTELIGEGCLQVYRHALQHLCSPTCLFVPHRATIYIEPVASAFLFTRHALRDIECRLSNQSKVTIKVPDQVKSCRGLADLDDMQVSMLEEGVDFKRFVKPRPVFTFVFNDLETLRLKDLSIMLYKLQTDVEEPVVVVMWWEIDMRDKILTDSQTTSLGRSLGLKLDKLSCAPTWARDDELLKHDSLIEEIYGRQVWREHWIQAIYYFSDVDYARHLANKKAGGEFVIHALHDSHSLWFDLKASSPYMPPNCGCGVHRVISRNQLAFLNDRDTMSKLVEALIGPATKNAIAAKIDFLERPLYANAISIEDAPKWFVEFEGLAVELIDLSLTDEIPWEKIMARKMARKSIDPIESFTIKCMQVQFDNLNRIRTDIKECEGFNMEELDKMISHSSNLADNSIESHSLWEYGGRRLDEDTVIYSSACSSQSGEFESGPYRRKFPFKVPELPGNWKRGWSLAFWAEFTLKNTHQVISTGPLRYCPVGEKIQWNRNCKQLVYFMHDMSHEQLDDESVYLDVGLIDSYLVVHRSNNYHTVSGETN